MISKKFNLGLFLFVVFSHSISALFDPEYEAITLWDYVYESNAFIGIFGAMLIVVAIILLSSFFLRRFWNSFVMDMFKLREINSDESLAMILIVLLFLR